MKNPSIHTGRTLTAYCQLCAISFLCCIALSAQAQTENTILNPKYFDDFIGYQVLPGDGVRIVAISDQNNSYGDSRCAVTDYYVNDPLSSAEPSIIDIPSTYFNHSVASMYLLPLSNSKSIISNTEFDCDYDPPGGILAIDSSQHVIWYQDFIEQFAYHGGGDMTFIDSTRIHVQKQWVQEAYLISTAGDLLEQVNFNPPFDTVLQSATGFIASNEDILTLLSSGFESIASYTLEGTIEHIHALTADEFIIATAAKFYLLSASQQLQELTIDRSTYYRVWKSKSYYWALGIVGRALVKLDTFFEPVDTLVIPPAMLPVIGLAFGSEMLMIAEYETHAMRGIVLWKGDEEVFDPALPQDMGVTDVIIPDSITVFYHPEPWEGGYNHYYPSVLAEVKNYGIDTVSHFTLHLNIYGECHAFCPGRQSIWEIDSLQLAPQQSAWIDLGDFSASCLYEANLDFCMSTMAPNQLADGNSANDRHCQPVMPTIIIGTSSAPLSTISITPNPAHDQINIINADEWQGGGIATVISMTGKIVQTKSLQASQESMDITAMAPGMYILTIDDHRGKRQITKLLVQ